MKQATQPTRYPRTTTLLTEHQGSIGLTRYQTTLPGGNVLEWARMTEPNQPDFRLFKLEGTWYFPARECRGYFGLCESAQPAKHHVPEKNRVLRPALDRAGTIKKIWLVDLEGLLILAKDAQADRRAVFVKRLATVILPLIGGDLRVSASWYRRLAQENREGLNRNHTLRLQNARHRETIARLTEALEQNRALLSQQQQDYRKLQADYRRLAVFEPFISGIQESVRQLAAEKAAGSSGDTLMLEAAAEGVGSSLAGCPF